MNKLNYLMLENFRINVLIYSVLKLLDILLFATHVFVISFNLLGWIWAYTRKAHLIVMGLTIFSWSVLGIWYGFGYCFLTDWEWDIKRQIGEGHLPHSFTQYLSDNVLGLNLSTMLVDGLTLGLFVVAIIITVWINFFKRQNTR